MKERIKPQHFKKIVVFLGMLLAVKAVWVAVSLLWLPAEGMNLVEEKGVNALYYRVKIASNEAPPPKRVPTSVQNAGSIKDIDLLAIYNGADETVVTVSYKKKTKVLSRGEEINGFELESAENNFALFRKGGKNYKVELMKSIKDGGRSSYSIAKPAESSPAETAPLKSESSGKVEGEIENVGDRVLVDKNLVRYYSQNKKDIFKDIRFRDQKRGKEVVGYVVTYVRRGSHFSKLGLQRGDVITSINGQVVRGYNAALSFYERINSLDGIRLTVQRGEKEMELEYEIN